MTALMFDPEGQERSVTIGDVLSLLRNEFPDISISKIRFLETVGLVTPQRAPSGYRRFSGDDIERLRLILLAQRDHFLPLRVIKERLDAGELAALVAPEPADTPNPESEVEGETSPHLGAGAADVPPDAESGPARRATPDIDPQQLFNRRELAYEAQLPLDVVRKLESFGVIGADEADRFTGAHVLFCRAFAVLRGHGVDERHLRQVKNGASRDASLIDQSVAHLDSSERTTAQETLLNAFSDAHFWLVMCEVNRSMPPSGHRSRRPRR
jgi:DNA-binding transcriptional MerR regulator